MVKQVDTGDLKSPDFGRAGSIPARRTKQLGQVGEWLIPADCKSAASGYAGSNPALSTTKESCMTQKETIERAYGNVPKELPGNISFFDWLPTWRGVKYYWYKLIRKITR